MNTWLLPDGINESLPDEAEKLEALRRHIVDLYATWGYRLVMPPLVEYMESLSAGMGTQLDLQTFKIPDQLNGRMMGIRADLTPQVARIDAHKLSKGDASASINRLCYIGTVLRTRSEEQGGSRSPVQVGAELFGHAGIESDVEIISLMLETLNSLAITNLVLDLGHVGIASGLAESVGLTSTQQDEYFDMLSRKSIPEIESWVETNSMSESDKEMLLVLPLLTGTPELLEDAKQSLRNAGDSVLSALDHLQATCSLLASQQPEIELHIDLSEMRGYAYHTGIMYTVYHTGENASSAVAQGGRYNGIGEAFGNNRPAIGFSTDLRTLANLSLETTELNNSLGVNGILIPNVQDESLKKPVFDLRAQGEQLIQQLDDKTDFNVEQLKEYGCNRVLEKHGETWVVRSN